MCSSWYNNWVCICLVIFWSDETWTKSRKPKVGVLWIRCCVRLWFTDVSNECSAFMFRIMQSTLTACSWRWWSCGHLKCQVMIAHWNSVTSQTTWIFGSTALSTSNLAWVENHLWGYNQFISLWIMPPLTSDKCLNEMYFSDWKRSC